MIHFYTNSGQEDTQVNTTYARPVENNASRIIKATDFAMSITGNNGGVSSYEGQGMTQQDIMKSAGAMDVTTNRNYMTVMSNSMSDEDFAELIKEGYKPGETTVETTVTVVDEIKAKLAQSGVIIEGYNDDLSDEVLQEITGSESAANAVKKAFREADLPLTAKNVQSAAEAMQLAGEITEITDGMCDYLLRNGIDPTIDHLYRVRFSGAEVSENMGGYYSDDIGGYMTKQSSDFDWKGMESRLSQTIEEAGLPVSEETLKEAQWLVKSGILFNETNIKILYELKNLQMPMSEEEIARSIANAIADGREAKDAYLNNNTGKLAEAVQAYEDVQSFSYEAVKVVVESGKSLNIRELRVAMQSIRIEGTVSEDGISLSVEATNSSMEAVSTESAANLTMAGVTTGSENPALVKAMRVLEETRLAMTVENNYRLMKLGYNIETTELSRLVEDLKAVEAHRQNTLFPKDSEAAQKATLWQATNDKLVTLAFMPAATVGRVVQTEGVHTLSSVHDLGEALRQDYIKAGAQYELLGTEVRADLGDSIKKAFGNVDDILKDLNFDINDTNRRAVRILGYNSMEVTVSNIESVRDADAGLQRVINKMTPASTLQLIRDGINPLETDLTTLENQLDAYESTIEQTTEKYSKFLFRLEKNHEITSEERDAYIGIYRLLHQIEKADGALVGNLLSQGSQMSFKNLLSAMRSGKSTGMDYCIDDTFGAMAKAAGYEFDISNQILKGFESAVIGNDEINREVIKEELGELREILAGDNADAVEELMYYEQDVTPDNIQSMQALLEAPDALQSAWSIFQNAAENGGKGSRGGNKAGGGNDTVKENTADNESRISTEEINALEEAVFALQDAFTDKESVTEAYGKLLEQAGTLLEESIMSGDEGRIDIKSMSTAYKQLSFNGNLIREENYEIPAYINGRLQGIRVKIVHKGESDGNVMATLATSKYGNIVAQFRLTDEKVQGYIACDSEEGTEALKAEGRFEKELAAVGKEAGDIRYLYSEKLDGTFLYRRHDKSVGDGGSTRDLYETAKLFISSMQDTER